MRRFKAIVVGVGTLVLAACGPDKPAEVPSGSGGNAPVDPPKPVDVGNDISSALKDQEFEAYNGPFWDRTPAPAISSYRQDPVSALGSIFAKVAKPSKTCLSTDATDYEYRRLIEQKPATCQSKTYPAATVASMLVDGKTATNIEYIVGKASANAEYAFEFTVSEPVTAALLNTEECVIDTKIDALKIPVQTCDLQYIAGVVVTQVSYRQYRKLEVDASASYVMKVGGQAYGSSEQLVNKWYMTVDTLDLTRFFGQNTTTGFLEKVNKELIERVALSNARTRDKNRDDLLLESLASRNELGFEPRLMDPPPAPPAASVAAPP